MLGAVVASGVAWAQPSAPVASLTGVQGNVLVSQADGMAAAASGQALLPGVRVITTAGGAATVTYSNGCNVALGANRRYTVRQQDACAEAKAPPLGKGSGFAVMGGSRVLNVGDTVVRGELGVSPGTEVKGFPPGSITGGQIHPADDLANEAQKDIVKAYDNLVAQRCDTRLSGQDLGGLTLSPGVYCFPGAAATLTGELLLDAEGNPNAVWVFQVGTTLTTTDKSVVRVINGGQGTDDSAQNGDRQKKSALYCNIYWQVAASAALGKESAFAGNILSIQGIDVANKATTIGRVLSRTGAVTLDTNTVDEVSCIVLAPFPPPWAGAAAVAGAIAIGAVIIDNGGTDAEPAPPLSPN